MNKKILYILLTVFSFLLCVLVATLLRSYPFIRGFIGDTIVIFLIFFFVKSIRDFISWKVALFSVLFAYIIEISQYFHLVKILGLEHNIILRIALGSTFDVKDLFAYTIGGILACLMDILLVSYILKKNPN